MHPIRALLPCALALPLSFTSAPSALEKPEVGAQAPEIEALAWFNHIGQAPSLRNLRGQAVLIEFWATWCKPCIEAWPHLQELHEEFEKDGLVILGLSDESEAKVRGFVEQTGYSARIAAGSTTGNRYGVNGIPETILVDPEGTIVYRGHPGGLAKGKVAEALKKARKPDARSALRLEPTSGAPAGLEKAVEAARRGELAKAMEQVDKSAAQGGAEALRGELRAHLELLLAQAAKLVEARDVGRALELYALLAKELPADEAGVQAKARLAAIDADAALQAELRAAEALEKTRKSAARLASGKARGEYEKFAAKHGGTRAAERALAIARRL